MDAVDDSTLTCHASVNLEGRDPETYGDHVLPEIDAMDPGQYVNVAIYREDAQALFDLLEDRHDLGYYFHAHCGCGGDLFRVVKLES